MREQSVNKSFITGATIIAFSHILVKCIGALFRIPLANLIQEEGMAVYQAAYSIYMVLFVISTAGLPVAISKLVSANHARGSKENIQKIFKVAFILLLTLGVVGTFILFAGAKSFAIMVGMEDSYPAIIALAPSLLFVSLSSVYRGYFQGHQSMFPTAISEVIESTFKLIVGLALAYFLIKFGDVFSASGAIIGVTTGSLFSVVFLTIYYLKYKKKSQISNPSISYSEFKTILIKILKIAIPITIGSSVFTLTTAIDTMMVLRRLQDIGYSIEASKTMFGYYSGYAITLYNLPATVIVGISISIVPAVSIALANNDKKQGANLISSAIRITWQMVLPAGIGMAVLASPILNLLFKNDFILPMNNEIPANQILAMLSNNGDATRLLTLLGLAIALVCVTMVTNAILQSLGNVWIPVRNMIIGGIVKVISNYVLIGVASINIMGAPISTTLCYVVITFLNIYSISRSIKVKYGVLNTLIKPVISVVVMSVVAIYSYNLFFKLNSNVIACGMAIALAGISYIVSMILIKGFKKSDIEILPKGELLVGKIGKWLA